MTKIEKLKNAGCDVETAVKRCDDDVAFYLELVESALEESRYEKIRSQLEADDWKGAFESFHALKGISANLSLTPLTQTASELTELFRPLKKAPFTEPLLRLLEERKKLSDCLKE